MHRLISRCSQNHAWPKCLGEQELAFVKMCHEAVSMQVRRANSQKELHELEAAATRCMRWQQPGADDYVNDIGCSRS